MVVLSIHAAGSRGKTRRYPSVSWLVAYSFTPRPHGGLPPLSSAWPWAARWGRAERLGLKAEMGPAVNYLRKLKLLLRFDLLLGCELVVEVADLTTGYE